MQAEKNVIPLPQFNMMMKKILVLLGLVLILFQAKGTHIVGGSMFYEHLGGSSYLVSIRLYKDCSPFSINFSTSLKVEIRKGDGTSPSPDFVRLPLLARDTLNPTVDTCAFNPGVCVELGVYSKIVNLPPQSGGYHLFYTDCCRNSSVANIASPLSYGEGLHTYIPDNNIYITNSSPVFTSYPPVYVCKDQDLNYDFSATDADGDSLSYELIKPYHGKNEYDPAYSGLLPTISATGTPPDNITFNNIVYLLGFSATNPLNSISGNGLSISSTGLLTGTPEIVGQFLVAVKVDEYRNGVKIGTVVRDFQYNVLDCPPLKDAAIGDIDLCSGTSVQMINDSGDGANGFWWDFGTGDPGDTSELEEPLFTFPNIGTYTVTLMGQKGTLCADTTYLEMKLTTLNGGNNMPDTLCLNEAGFYNDQSTTSFNDTITYIAWDFGDNTLDTGNIVEHSFSATGDYTVEMIVRSGNGCMDTIAKNIHVRNPPSPDFTPTISCNTQTVEFVNSSSNNATEFWWQFGTGNAADTSVVSDPVFSFPTYGTYPVTMVSQKGTACADTIVKNVSLYEVNADFSLPDTLCENGIAQFSDSSTVNSTTIDSWQWSFGAAGNSNLQNPQQNFTNAGVYDVQLVVGTASTCTDTLVKQLVVVELPSVQFSPNDLCSGLSVSFDNQSNSAATGFIWNFGTGQPTDTSSAFEPSFDFPSFGTYNVTLTANPNSTCSASSNLLINVSNVEAEFNAPDTVCAGSTLSLTDQSTASNTLVQWHWNFDDFTTSVSQNNIHEFNQAGIYNVELIVYASDGCSDTISKPIEVLGLPIVNGGVDTAQCISDADITLTGTAQNSNAILWTGNGGSFTPGATSNTVTYTANSTEINTGSTFVVYSSAMNPFCPIISDTVFIDIIEIPEIEVLPDFSICEDANFIAIDGTVTNTSQTVWTTTNGTGTIVNQNIINTAYNPSQADLQNGSVSLVLSSFNIYGCQDDSDTLTITFAPIPVVDIDFPDTVCFLSSLDLVSNINTGEGYWQTIGDGIFTPSDTGANVAYTTGIIDSDLGYADLIFHSLNNNGCAPLTDSFRIIIIPNPEIDLTTGISCLGSPSELIDNTDFIEPIIDWMWYVGDSIYSGSEPTHQFPDTGYFDVTLVITSASGCSDSAIIPIKVNDLPVADFTPIEPCIYGAYFADSSYADSTSIDSWSWSFGDGDSSTVQNPTHIFDSIGSYQVTLQVVSGFGCLNSVTYEVPIYPPPVAQFTFFPNPAQVDDIIDFTSTAYSDNAPIVSWDWDFSNGDTSDLINPSTSYESGGTYDVVLVVFDEVGCRDTAEQRVFISHGPKVPAAFSPNGDGVNDFLMILGSGFEEIDFTIYNNWGRVLYNTKDVNDQGWDGTYNDEPQPMGVYVYKAWVKNIYGEEIEISGDATIIR